VSALDVAAKYTARGWRVVPLQHAAKAPVLHEWQTLRLDTADLPRHFDGQPLNIGVLLGAPSGDLADVDLDAPEAVALADAFLPSTAAVFGRAGKPRSHYEYVAEIETEKFADVDGSMLVEIRSTGGQTVFPGSTHPSGEQIEWAADGEPAPIEAGELRRAVVQLACAAVLARHWPRGSRHDAALAAAGFLRRAGIDEELVVKIITSAARVAGDEEWSDRKRAALDTIAALRNGESATGGPRLAELLVSDGAKVVERMRRWLGADEERGTSFNLTDAGNAQRFARQHGADVRYCYAWSCWLVWDGRRWARDAGDGIMARAKETARAIYAEAVGENDPGRRKALAAWAKTSENKERLRAMVMLAQSEPGVPVAPDELDRDGFLLNVENGTVDLRMAQLRPHRREELVTKLARVTFDPDATCPRFLCFLERIMNGDRKRIGFLQRALGYSLTGDTREQCFFVPWGSGANGKSTLTRAVFRLLGDYAAGTRADAFMVKYGDTIPNDIARLNSARFVLATEAEENQKLAESLVKSITGGDVLTARFMRAEYFDFVPVLKLWLATNHRPVIRGTDYAMWRRVRLIPFDVTIPDDEMDATLLDKLAVEACGILAWLVAGCRAWLAGGLGVPESIRAATGDYRAAMDTLGAFIVERCATDADAEIPARELYEEYGRWCSAGNEKAMTKKALGLRLTERGFVAIRTEHERGWRGIRLRTALDAEPPADEASREDAWTL
jgi:putative DNA primase/helicase